jgi:SOS response regulatory protein OraA/RecX
MEEASPPRLTAIRRHGAARVALEVDGQRWRVVPEVVVSRCGLVAGMVLDRRLLRALGRELRHAEAVDLALRTLARRDVSVAGLRERLQRRGVRASDAETALSTLGSAGLVDDGRFARERARCFAERGWGDAAVRVRLGREGIRPDLARAAVVELAPEPERAAELASSAADRRAAWKLLARRGFSAESIEEAVGALDEEL